MSPPPSPFPAPKRVPSRVRFGSLGITPLDGGGRGKKEPDAHDDEDRAALPGRLSEPGTPNISEAAAHLRRTLSLASLDTLLLLTSPSLTRATPTSTEPTRSQTAVFTTGTDSTSSSRPSSPPTFSSEIDAFARDEDERRKLLDESLERRRMEARELLRDVKGALWRPAGEGPKRPQDLERVFVLAMRKATRSFISAYGIRAGVNLILFLFKTVSSRSFNPRHLFQSLFSFVPLRFSLLLSTFSYLHCVGFHVLRLAPTPTYFKRRISHSLNLLRTATAESSSFLESLEEGLDVLSREAPFGPPSAEWDATGGERRWHAGASGFFAGAMSIYWISSRGGERRGVVEQLVVRGLQGFWNGSTRRMGIHIPGGEILLFGLCSGNLMHSWLRAPERNPPSFNAFISGAFQGPSSAVAIQRSLFDSGKLPQQEVQNLLSYKRGVTQKNRAGLRSILETLGGHDLPWDPPCVPCCALHPDHDSCTSNLVARFFLVFQHMLPIYSALHFIPPLLFKRRLLFSSPSPSPSSTPSTDLSSRPFSDDLDTPLSPSLKKTTPRKTRINWKELTKLLWRGLTGTMRSGSFLAGFVLIFHGLVCLQHKLYPRFRAGRLRELLVSSGYMWFAGFSTTFSLFLEEKRRRSELALYVLPRGLSAAHSMLRKRALVPRHVPLGEGILAGLAMAVLADRTRWGPEDLGGLVRRVMYQFT